MATSDFLPFGVGAGANVINQADWAALAQRGTGFQSGVAQSAQLNKAWRQSSIMSAVLAQFICDRTGQSALDDGTTAALLANLKTSTAALNGDPANSFSVAAATQAQHAVPLAQVPAASVPATSAISANTLLPASASGTFYEITAGVATLPAPADKLFFEFWGTGAATGSIASPSATTLQFPDGAIASGGSFPIGLNTAVRVRSDGASWLITNISGVVRAKSAVITGAATVGTATDPGHAMQLGQATGRLLNVQYITVSGTYTPTPGAKTALVEGVGGGGGGGGTPNPGTGSAAAGGGGSSGAWGRLKIVNPVAASVTIGAGGGGIVGSAGGAGGTTSFGSSLFLPGGGGAPLANVVGAGAITGPGGAISSVPGGGDISYRGAVGNPGFVISISSGTGGNGSSSPLGGGGLLASTNSVGSAFSGSAGQGYGAGGGGGIALGASATSGGGAGAPGIIIVTEYS